LENLWTNRMVQESADTASSGFTIGPGDVLRISLPQLDQMKDRTVRVSEHNTIDLPLLGVIKVTGMSQEDLRDELSRRVEQYVYKPQVAVYLEQTENRLVAVLGAVKTPGRYMLASRSDTVMTMISRAGGMAEDAASRIILIPVPSTPKRAAVITAAANQERSFPTAQDGSDASGILRTRSSEEPDDVSKQMMAEGVIIDLSRSTNQRYLALPAKPGDVIIVPAAGEVTVQGWVDKPGAFKITPGMTVLGATAAAGGALFSSSATLLREQGNGGKLATPLNLAQIKSGAEPDIPLEGGDVVIVDRSAAGALPYSVYFLINRLGIGVPLIP
jgi:polysaccharide export outer membrane protein